MKQLDLFVWADTKPSNVIDARHHFEARVVAIVQSMLATNRPPAHVDGKVIKHEFSATRGAA